MMTPPLIWMNGYPGSGKFMIAQMLAQLPDYENLGMIDHYRSFDERKAAVRRESQSFQRVHQAHRLKALSSIPSKPENIILISDCQLDDELGRNVARDHINVAEFLGLQFIYIKVTCSIDEIARQLRSQDRVDGATGLRSDPEALMSVQEQGRLLWFGGYDEWEIDVTKIRADVAARKIREHVNAAVDRYNRNANQA